MNSDIDIAIQNIKEEDIYNIQNDFDLLDIPYTFELAWKSLKDYLEYMGLTEKTGSPREIIQQAFKQGIIEDGEAWINMMLSRNMLSQLYDEKASRDIFNKIKKEYINLFSDLNEKYKNM